MLQGDDFMVKISHTKEYEFKGDELMMYINLGQWIYIVWRLLCIAAENLTVACVFLLLYYFNEWQWIKYTEVFSVWLFITLSRLAIFFILRYIKDIKEEIKEAQQQVNSNT